MGTWETDTVGAVKDDLLLDFKPLQNNPKGAILDVEYDVTLLSKRSTSQTPLC